MTLPSSGPISLDDVNVELGNAPGTNISLNDTAVRDLAGIPSGPISLQDLYGKSAFGSHEILSVETVTFTFESVGVGDLFGSTPISTSRLNPNSFTETGSSDSVDIVNVFATDFTTDTEFQILITDSADAELIKGTLYLQWFNGGATHVLSRSRNTSQTKFVTRYSTVQPDFQSVKDEIGNPLNILITDEPPIPVHKTTITAAQSGDDIGYSSGSFGSVEAGEDTITIGGFDYTVTGVVRDTTGSDTFYIELEKTIVGNPFPSQNSISTVNLGGRTLDTSEAIFTTGTPANRCKWEWTTSSQLPAMASGYIMETIFVY